MSNHPKHFGPTDPASLTNITELRQFAESNPDAYWSMVANKLSWFKTWDSVQRSSFKKPVSIRWYEGGKLNVSFNCIDRHLSGPRADKTALIWEPDQPGEKGRSFTYRELAREVGRFANTLKKYGVKKGDVVTIYLPMIPEAAFAMLACSRIGAIHSVVFGGFSPDSISDRMLDGRSGFVITADEGLRAGKHIPLKENVNKAIEQVESTQGFKKIEHVLVIKRTGADVAMTAGRDLYYEEASQGIGADCPPVEMDAEDPLFLLYTSGSTSKPKGVLHTTGGYLAWATFTHELVFNLKEDDIYWCTADVGWITGHSYLVYGPLANGATTLMFEGVPNYPDNSRFWNVVDKYGVTILYTAPTAIRALMREGNEPVKKTSRKSLRLLGSVGEPINPEAWLWYYDIVGDGRCPIVDTWWQTETGGILISPVGYGSDLKPGSATYPLPGIKVQLVDEKGVQRLGATEGNLVITGSWPGQARTLYGDHGRFEATYFSTYEGSYFTGDGCRRDEDGYYWITGRVDDVLNVAGHRLGTAEIESALVSHPKVAEAAVVGFPHDIKGQGIYCYVTLNAGESGSDQLKRDLIQLVRQHLSPIATPDAIQWAPGLPKTRSGKIMRRILRKIAEAAADETEADFKSGKVAKFDLGDTSTLADPGVVQDLVKTRQPLKKT
ncbi:MAG: acetate--CoA ligase [Bdellovibrionales bacterium]|jgi:acetyl-CoA synthetase|nr:acetate--CoA ligase [Bdellovibrionales bacterium]